MSHLRMPAGWKGVQQSAEEWVRWALHDASGSSSFEVLAESLIAIAEHHGLRVEELVEWIYNARELSPAAWRRVAGQVVDAKKQLEALQLASGRRV